ncbi:MAG: hypothetical protein E6Q97_22890 [Desulfurellales bacterium]|nr:MAG: hypothetical protein E6Q97_22890 [Desulfurellales bacterium]
MKHSDIKTWIAQQDWSKGYAAVAQTNGISYEVARDRARRAGVTVKLMKRGRKHGTRVPLPHCRKIKHPEQLDFTQRDTHLARQYGVSRERIRQLRKEAGIAPFPRGGKANKPTK